jgi:NTE family protein
MSQSLEHWLHENPFELFLGAGYFGFYAHVGFVKALAEQNLKPKKFHGSSAGAIIGAMLANGSSAKDVEEIVLNIKREDFWDPGIGLGLLKGKKYHELLSKHLPENFSALKSPLDIAVFDIFSFRNRILNSGDLRSAVRGSSAFPGLFQPVKIHNRYFMDGGLYDRFPAPETPLLAHCFKKQHALKKDFNHVTISIKNLPRSGPGKMHLAGEIISVAYVQTKKLLNEKI